MKNILAYFVLFAVLIALTVQCQKTDIFPKTYYNVKATDCIYYDDGAYVRFTYVSNTPTGERYKREILTGYCFQDNVKDFGEEYLWMDTCYITKIGTAYME